MSPPIPAKEMCSARVSSNLIVVVSFLLFFGTLVPRVPIRRFATKRGCARDEEGQPTNSFPAGPLPLQPVPPKSADEPLLAATRARL